MVYRTKCIFFTSSAFDAQLICLVEDTPCSLSSGPLPSDSPAPGSVDRRLAASPLARSLPPAPDGRSLFSPCFLRKPPESCPEFLFSNSEAYTLTDRNLADGALLTQHLGDQHCLVFYCKHSPCPFLTFSFAFFFQASCSFSTSVSSFQGTL